MSADEVVASDVLPRYLFLTQIDGSCLAGKVTVFQMYWEILVTKST